MPGWFATGFTHYMDDHRVFRLSDPKVRGLLTPAATFNVRRMASPRAPIQSLLREWAEIEYR
jgi:hypothetical protein